MVSFVLALICITIGLALSGLSALAFNEAISEEKYARNKIMRLVVAGEIFAALWFIGAIYIIARWGGC